MYIKRAIYKEFKRKLVANKVLVLLGARRVGKTELIDFHLKTLKKESYLKLNGEDLNSVTLLSERTITHYTRIFRDIELLVIDEAQAISEIGLILKLIVDHVIGLKIIATGSSMFDLTNKLGEPLVGRKNTLYLFPLAQMEFQPNEKITETITKLEERLIFGSYPELEKFIDWNDKKDYLKEVVNAYLLKDILAFDGIKNADKIMDLLRLIAFQIGKEVSLQELGTQLGMSKNTVEKYLDLLSKVFIIFKVNGFSKNLRKEITKNSRWYFYDNGIRNAVIENYNRLNLRNDIGDIWENYIISERIKFQHYTKMDVRNYFWRTYDQQEIDWIEETADKLDAFEIKWNSKRKSKIPGAWKKNYSKASFSVINNKNYIDWILEPLH